MSRLRKLAMHEKEEHNRTRSMSMSMSSSGMPPMMGGMPPVINGSGTASALSTPAMSNMPNPMARPQSQASGRIPQQPGMGQPGQPPIGGPGAPGQPGMPQQQGPPMGPSQMNGPGPQQPGPPQPGMGQGPQRPQQPGMGMQPTGIQMTPNMTHASTPHASTPSAPHLSSSPSPVPTPPQSFAPGGPGPQQPPFNQFNPSQPQFSGPGGPGQPPFTGQPGQFQGAPGNNPQFRQGPNQNGHPVQNASFPPNSAPGFQPGGPGNQNFPGQRFHPGGPQQPFQSGPGNAQFAGAPGLGGPGGQFPPSARQGVPGPGLQFSNNNQAPEWGQRPPPLAPGGPEPGRRADNSWEDGQRSGVLGGPQNKMIHGQMRYGQPGPGGPPPNMMGQPGMGGPMSGPVPSPKEDARSVTPQQMQANWGEDGAHMQRRQAVAAQGGQMGPGRPGFHAQGPQKRPGSPPPSATMNNLGGGSPPEKRVRPNDPGPAVLVDSRMGPDGRPTSSKGGVPFPGGPGMNGQPGNSQQQQLNAEQQYRQQLGGATQEMRGQVLRQGGPQPAPFGKGQQQVNGANPGGRGSRPPDVPSPASGGEGPGQPRQVINVKGQGGSMGPPVSPSLAHRNVGGVKKSESAGNSPALPPSTVPNGMNPADRSHTPHQMRQGGSHSPMPAPMTRPQSAQPTMNQGPSIGVPAPPPSAPPMMPTTQSPSNGFVPFGSNKLDQQFEFPEDVDLSNFDEMFTGMMDPILGLDSWANGAE
ncbi:Basic proline-rich protein [Rhizoctonia solani]|uniref:Basic proline-rich protein n=1 Tax=Rhizoctonia solani TaxID=456999 RepID=A0A0K6FPW1_9AGAM|nr:Basic proline-rich protein [Rhizoctonia solani]